jgi:hypothetical protein
MMRMIRRKIGTTSSSLALTTSCTRSNNNNNINQNVSRFLYHTIPNRTNSNTSISDSRIINTTTNGIIFHKNDNNVRCLPVTMLRSCRYYDWNHRSFSSNPNDDDNSTSISLSSPDILLPEMSIGIAKTMQFYIRYGISNRQSTIIYDR